MSTNVGAAGWAKATPQERIAAANYDCMRHPEFSVLAGVIALGEIKFTTELPTAGTDGLDVMYNPDFVMTLSRQQARFLVLHENFHKSLKHCIRLDQKFAKVNKDLCNVAMDFVDNAWIYQGDPEFKFMEWIDKPKPLLDPKYFGWSVEQVINDLIKRAGKPKPKGLKPQGNDGQRGSGGKQTVGADDLEIKDGGGVPDGEGMDQHIPGKADKPGEGGGQRSELEKEIDNAIRQGKILSNKLRSKEGTGGRLNMEDLTPTKVRWQDVLREFFVDTCKGAEMARWSKINSRIFSATRQGGRAGVCLPTLYDERVGEVVIAGDTSGSMGSFYPILFGEIAGICQLAKPESVLMLWWDTRVAGTQTFKPDQYDTIAQAMQPAGGGGTEPSVVYDWLQAHNKKPQCIVFITDGYIGNEPHNPLGVPVLWCIIDNRDFVPKTGKAVYVDV